MVFAGQRIRVRGALKPYVAGQKAVVRFYLDGRKVAAREVAIQRVNPTFGRFLVGFQPDRAGRLVVRVSHPATPELSTVLSTPRVVSVVDPTAPAGSRGSSVKYLQSRLAGLHYAVSRSGVMDASTQRAVQAFRKLTGMARTFTADRDVFRAIAAGKGAFQVRYPDEGKHVEGDLTHQVLAEVEAGGKVRRIYVLSSGKPSTPTVLGRFHVYSKTPGTNAKGMVDANYFIRGYAIHGYFDVPPYAASHGCLRIPIPDARAVFRWVSFGDPVDVYYRSAGHRAPKPSANAGP